MKKIILSGLSGVVIGVVIAALLFAKCQPRPRPIPTVTVTTQPGPNTIQERGQGNLSGSVPWKSPAGQNKLAETNKGNNNSPNPGEAPSGPAFGSYTIPVTGELTTDYYYGGRVVGTGTHQIAGETTVTLAPEAIKADTMFEDMTNLRVDLPEQPWRLYLDSRLILIRSIYSVGWNIPGQSGGIYLVVSEPNMMVRPRSPRFLGTRVQVFAL